MPLTSSVSETFQENGFVAQVDVLDADETQQFQQNFTELQESIGKENAQYSLHNIHLKHPWVLGVAAHRNILKPVTDILGPDVLLLDSRFICKYPSDNVRTDGDSKPFVAWHQDVRYWGIEGEVVTAWIAVDDADVENGCMRVIPGTHKAGLLEHVISTDIGNLLSSNQSIPGHLVDDTQAVPCPVSAGQSSLHHGLLVHGSEPNVSTRRRCGFVVRYVSTKAKPIQDPDRPRSFPCTVLLCGINDDGNFVDNRPDWFQPTKV